MKTGPIWAEYVGVNPYYGSEGAAGADLYAIDFGPAGDNYQYLDPGQTVLIGTGMRIRPPEGWHFMILPRSSVSSKGLLVHTGTIDADYRGELKVCVTNVGSERVEIKCGDRIAQLKPVPDVRVLFTRVKELDETERGEGGFGSTGK